ncbi:MAG: GNAT family N-acetyltransferase [Defluviitaleaceae bacterium]|nr:GNAT family N-acetyltransferase [Defluviitaleaceae bacterium]
MQFIQYTDVKAFDTDVSPTMLHHEAQNIIPLGNIKIGAKGEDKTTWRDPANWFMATISNHDGLLLTAIMTPPHNLTLYATNNQNNPETIICLINEMAQRDITIPGVMAEKSLVEMFVPLYTTRHNLSSKIKTSQRIYELTEVNPAVPKAGIRLAVERDMAFLPYWHSGFMAECFETPFTVGEDGDEYRYHINSNRLYIMEDNGAPVTMAKIGRELVNVCAIGLVYTPPYFRGKGYATACVAAVSQMGLNRGFKNCVLYTDLANPTSNSIYQKIGYKPICDSLEVVFE